MKKRYASATNYAQQIDLQIGQKKTELMILNITNPSPIRVNGEDLPTTEERTCLGSIVRHDGGAGNDISSHLNKARNAFRMLNNIWRSQQYSIKTKLRLNQSCVFFTLLYGSECWRMTVSSLTKISVFYTRNL